MRNLKFAFLLVAAAILTGCAHPVMISPKLDQIALPADAKPKSLAKVAYFIPADLLAKEVVTPGGGGDKVTSYPYRDLETSFYKMLSNVFDGAVKVKSADDREAMAAKGISYLITPTITVNSDSSSAFTWPPTDYTVNLQCAITDKNGKLVDTKTATGNGQASFSEFKADVGLSGKRAAEAAMLKMQKELLDAQLPALN
ncbi:hypothetical protein ACN9MZ_23895 [Pseudoduganella sp. S-14]|uniref:hypothetical protein n=1 Tax=Pseudoduganella sp. S-14 TaxID=3404065 RepID=UPI003CEBE825